MSIARHAVGDDDQTNVGGARLVDRRYAVRREIGRGGSCIVHEAVHRFTRRVVALKRLLEQHKDDPILRVRLLREAEALAAVSHPNVVQVLDAGEELDGAPYVALEYLDGRSLEGLIAARGALHARDALFVVRELCAAIGAVHAAGFVHRDVKPSNVLVLPTNQFERLEGARVRLLDFGIVSTPRFEASRKLTQENALIGTLEYMAPERVVGGAETHAVAGDVYALGVTLFECLTGRAPFEGDPIQIVAQLTASPPPSARSVRADVPAVVEPILERALHREPNQRYPDAQQMERELTAALQSMKETTVIIDTSRRRHLRAPYVTPVRLEEGDRVIDGRTEDLSASGLMVVLPSKPRDNARVKIRFALPTTGEYVTSDAVVRWTRDHKGRARHTCAVGLEFETLEPRARVAIEKFVHIVGTLVERSA